MSDYYDRDLNPMDSYSNDKTEFAGRRVLRHRGVCGYDVSTVWLGLDHQHDNGTPIVFETLIWGPGDSLEVAGLRHRSEESAARWHLKAVDAIRAGRTPSFDDDWMEGI